MDKATDRGVSGGAGAKSPAGEKSSRRRGSQLDKLTIDATVVVRAKAPAGSRHKGYEEIVVQDLNLRPAGNPLLSGALGNAGGRTDHRRA